MARTDSNGITHDYQSSAPLGAFTGDTTSYSASKDGVTVWAKSEEEAEAKLLEKLSE